MTSAKLHYQANLSPQTVEKIEVRSQDAINKVRGKCMNWCPVAVALSEQKWKLLFRNQKRKKKATKYKERRLRANL